jgi:nucleotide-binding universal stress UspA family protein
MSELASAAEPTAGASPRLFGNVLCAVDGTRMSLAAVEQAAELAGHDGHLTLLAVTALRGSAPPSETAAISPARAEGILAQAAQLARNHGVAASAVQDPRFPAAEVILERAGEHDLLAMGAPVIPWLAGVFLDEVAVSVLRRFSVPMLLARRSPQPSLRGRRILVASDGSEASDRVVAIAIALAVEQDAQLRLVCALESETHAHPYRIQAQASSLRERLTNAGGPHVQPGHPPEVILEALAAQEAALVVMGSRRLRGLRLLGSVSRRVAHAASCSVLLIPPS